MSESQPSTVYLEQYRVPDYFIDKTELFFTLGQEQTVVKSKLQLRRNPQLVGSSQPVPLILDGEQMLLQSIAIDGKELAKSSYQIEAESLTINDVPASFVLECTTLIKPQENTSLEGLYKSHSMFCTQCEAQGFRKITYYLDRPDVMSVFTVTITADQKTYPLLLSNGNIVDKGINNDGSHWVRWQDPHKKPAYLFALVAGDLCCIDDQFITQSGKVVSLRIYVEEKDSDKCDHAMKSLIRAMRWDEQQYGREYDLSIFNIVAVDDFNMGAMENKSLNVFNTSCVLAKPETTTDQGFQRIEGIVAHEYFHNWSGNRVTCRDWFQLSLKEGFTVYRDAQFSSDMGSATVKRVEDVALLRTTQFAEDAGPMAHPIRPSSYIEISNFYTATVYDKGAEVVRMINNLLGDEHFRAGSDLYFDRHDGQAVTCDDFVIAMEQASGKDLTQFRRWYFQSGTPHLSISGDYDLSSKTYCLKVLQSCPATPGQLHKEPFHIPLAVALLGSDGPMRLDLEGSAVDASNVEVTELVLDIKELVQKFVFKNITESPVPSLLRGFSAPVKIAFDYTRDELAFIVGHDTDGFSRWDASQQLGVDILQEMMVAAKQGESPEVDGRLIQAYRLLLEDQSADKAMVALMLKLPTEEYMAEISGLIDAPAIFAARSTARLVLAEQLQEQLWRVYHRCENHQPYEPTAQQIAQRSLKNTVLGYLMLLESDQALQACQQQYQAANNMTDKMAALNAIINSSYTNEKNQILTEFYHCWQHEPLVVNQWLAAQARCPGVDALDRVQALITHPAFDSNNPNKVRALIRTFCVENPTGFHQQDGGGYRFLADQIIRLNSINPQVAARLLTPLTRWEKVIETGAVLMKAELERILTAPNLSKDVYEIVSKSLKCP